MTPPIVKRYSIAFDQYKWVGFGAFLLVIGAASFVAVQPSPPPEYQGEGTMVYTQPAVIFSKTGTDIQQQAQVLTREGLLTEPVIRATAERVNIKPDKLLKALNIRLPKPPGKDAPASAPLFTLLYTSTDPKLPEAVINTMMEVMIEQSRLVNTQRLRSIMDEINKRLPDAEKDLRQAEQELERYTKQEGAALLAAQDGSLIAGITGIQGQQRQIQFQLQGVEAQIRSLQQRLGLNPDQAYASSALSADPILANLRAQIYQAESQLVLLSKDLRPEHPNMIALRKQLQTYEELLRQRAAEVIGGNGMTAPLQSASQIRQDSSLDPARQQLAQQMVALKTQQDTLRQQLVGLALQEQKLRQEYLTIPNKQLEQARLQQKVQLKQGLYSKMQAALVDAQAAEAETVSSLVVVRPAKVNALPQQTTNPIIIIGAGAFVGVAVGGALIFLLGSLGGVLQTMEDIRAALVERDVEVLGILPYMLVLDPEGGDIPVIAGIDSPYLELYERFRSNLLRASDPAPKVVLFTSTANNEGKSLSAYNLAIASARAGKRTLLIEADLRSPSLSKAVKVASDPDAAVEPLRYYGSLSECIRLVPDVENLYLVPSPGPTRQPAAILESSEFQNLLADARNRFDRVVVDAPALSLCNDPLLLEPLTDGMVLVTRPGYTGANMLAEAADQLTESEDLRLLGAIINGADMPPPTTPTAEPKESFVTESETLEEEGVRMPTGLR